MALGSTQALTRMSSRDLSLGVKGVRCLGLTTLPPLCADCLVILGASTSWNPKGLPRPVMGWLDLYVSCIATYCGSIQMQGVWNESAGTHLTIALVCRN